MRNYKINYQKKIYNTRKVMKQKKYEKKDHMTLRKKLQRNIERYGNSLKLA